MHDKEQEILAQYGITNSVGMLFTYFDEETKKTFFFALERGLEQFKRYESEGDWSFENLLGVPDNVLDSFNSLMDHRTVKGESVVFYPYNTAVGGDYIMFLLALCEVLNLTVTFMPKQFSEYGHGTWVLELKKPPEGFSL